MNPQLTLGSLQYTQTKHVCVIKAHLLRALRALFANTAPMEEDSGGPTCAQWTEAEVGEGCHSCRTTGGGGQSKGGAPVGGPAPIQLSPVLDQAATADRSFFGAERRFQWVQVKITSDLLGQILTLRAPL